MFCSLFIVFVADLYTNLGISVSPAKRGRARPRHVSRIFLKLYFVMLICVCYSIYLLFLADGSLYIGRPLRSIDELCNVKENNLKEMNQECRVCSPTEREDEINPALYFANELISSFCCNNGKVLLDPLQPVPELENRIVQVQTRDEYLDKIRNLNSSFAFISMGVKLEVPLGHGPFVFRIHGKIQHLIGRSVIPLNNFTPKYASLYFIEAKQALAARVYESANENIPKAIFESLQSFLLDMSPYAKAFKHLYEVEQQQQKFVFSILL